MSNQNQNQPRTNALPSRNMKARVEDLSSHFATYELTVELPLDVALDVYFQYSRSKKRCSDMLADRLLRSIGDARADGSDVVEASVRYGEKGWKTWLLKVQGEGCYAITRAEQKDNLQAFYDLLEGL